MKKSAFSLKTFFSIAFGKGIITHQPVPAPIDFYTLEYLTIAGKPLNFASFKGKKLLIVNTASKCGFTPQFNALEQLYQQYKDKLVILGFPSNDFGAQDPGKNEEIQEFCQLNYGVTFQMMQKSEVVGAGKNPVYQWLTNQTKNGWNNQEPTWNFCKYLIDEQGRLMAFFPSKVKPMKLAKWM